MKKRNFRIRTTFKVLAGLFAVSLAAVFLTACSVPTLPYKYNLKNFDHNTISDICQRVMKGQSAWQINTDYNKGKDPESYTDVFVSIQGIDYTKWTSNPVCTSSTPNTNVCKDGLPNFTQISAIVVGNFDPKDPATFPFPPFNSVPTPSYLTKPLDSTSYNNSDFLKDQFDWSTIAISNKDNASYGDALDASGKQSYFHFHLWFVITGTDKSDYVFQIEMSMNIKKKTQTAWIVKTVNFLFINFQKV